MSIYLNYNDINTQDFVLTLSEKSLLTTSGETYEIYFINEQTGNEYHTSFEDVSNYPERYNKFEITTETGSTSTGNIPFPIGGWYKYEAYSTTGKTELFELGKCYVDDGKDEEIIHVKQENVYVYKK